MKNHTSKQNTSFPGIEGIPLMLMTGEELAIAMKYKGVTNAFRSWCTAVGIKPVPGRLNVYDPKQVRMRLDTAQGLLRSEEVTIEHTQSLVALRHARKGNT